MKIEYIKTNDDTLYEVIRTIPEIQQIDTEKFRILTNSTNVFRKDGLYWFVRIIEEAQIVEENLEV
jgi:hypothetical protein